MSMSSVSRVIVSIASLLFAGLAMELWVVPEQAAQRLGIEMVRATGMPVVRADLGGLFAGMAMLCAAAAWAMRHTLSYAAAIMLVAIAVGRTLGWIASGVIGNDLMELGIELGVIAALCGMATDTSAVPSGTRRTWRTTTAVRALLLIPVAGGAAALLSPGLQQQIFDRAAQQMAATINSAPLEDDALRVAHGAHHCYLELHIEQGGSLERQGIPVGVVEGIVGIDRYEVMVTGFANHAGTTPMPDRQDALLAASQLTIAVNQVVNQESGRHVGTVGRMDVTPNSPNVIPGVVRLTIELRDLSPETLGLLADKIRLRAAEIARDTRTSIQFTSSVRNTPANAALEVQQAIERSAGRLGLASQRMPSGAGHDAQMMARLSPMGMIFVPSISGISHSPLELTSWEDCARGADILLGTVLEMDRA